jgi:hypothetical protein
MIILLPRLAALMAKIRNILHRVESSARKLSAEASSTSKNDSKCGDGVHIIVVVTEEAVLFKREGEVDWKIIRAAGHQRLQFPVSGSKERVQMTYYHDDASSNTKDHQHVFDPPAVRGIPPIQFDQRNSDDHQWTQIFPSGMSVDLNWRWKLDPGAESGYITNARTYVATGKPSYRLHHSDRLIGGSFQQLKISLPHLKDT